MVRSLLLAALAFTADASPIVVPLTKHQGANVTVESIKNKIVSRFAEGGTHNLPLHNENDMDYLGTVGLGTPPQNFSILFDTGSAEFWVASASSHSPGKTFDPSKSSTYKDTGKPFSIHYGSGSAAGTVITDVINLAGLSTTVNAGLANEVGGTQNFDGLLGLGLKVQADADLEPPLNVLKDQGLIEKGEFSIYLSRNSSVLAELAIGGIDDSKHTGEFTYVSLTPDNKGYWMVPSDGVSLGSNSLDKSAQTIVDSGTSLIVVPQSAQSVISSSLGCTVNPNLDNLCVWTSEPDVSTLPDLTVSYGGKNFPVSAKDYVIHQQGLVFAGFMALDLIPGSATYILGDIFMRNYYTNFDFDGSRIGFAPSI